MATARATRQQDLQGDWPDVRQGLADDVDHFVNVINRNGQFAEAQIQALLARIVALEAIVSQLP